MDDTGYCTAEDVRRALREKNLPGDAEQDRDILLDAITAQTEWLEKKLKRHWYEPEGNDIHTEDTDDIIPTSTKSRDDEEDIPTGGAHVVGEPVTPKTWQGSYTRIRLARRHADSISKLLVRTPDGYEDWTTEHSGGTWPDAVGDDYYLRVNNGGVSQLYLDTENLLDADGEPLLDTYSNAVYVTYSYGHEGIPKTIRRAVAFRAASDLTEEAAIQVPDNAKVRSVDALADEFLEKSNELLEEYL